MSKARMPDWTVWIMVAFVCWHAMVEITLAIHDNCYPSINMNAHGVPISDSGLVLTELEYPTKNYDINTAKDKTNISVSQPSEKNACKKYRYFSNVCDHIE